MSEDEGRFTEPPLRREDLGIALSVMRQIERCNKSIGNDAFAPNVRALISLLPKAVRDRIEARSIEYKYEQEEWRYTYYCSTVRLGTPSDPFTSDGEPPNEDWSNVISPRRVVEEVTDYEALYRVALEECEADNLTYKSGGRTRVIKPPRDEPAPTPKFEEDGE